MSPSEITNILRRLGGGPVHARGQNFLLDEKVVEAMCEAAGVGPDSNILEVGPGLGMLTGLLLGREADVVAVELDRRFMGYLGEKYARPNLKLVGGDILDFRNSDLLSRFAHPGRGYKVVANLPYGVTSAVIEKFLTEDPRPESLTVMIQREVADRLLAKPRDMSSIAVFAQTLGEPRRVVAVPPTSFFPPPKVHSAVISIRVRTAAELSKFFGDVKPVDYFAVVKAGFSEKRRQLGNSLRKLPNTARHVDTAMRLAGISEKSRPEELLPEQWLGLTKNLYN